MHGDEFQGVQIGGAAKVKVSIRQTKVLTYFICGIIEREGGVFDWLCTVIDLAKSSIPPVGRFVLTVPSSRERTSPDTSITLSGLSLEKKGGQFRIVRIEHDLSLSLAVTQI